MGFGFSDWVDVERVDAERWIDRPSGSFCEKLFEAGKSREIDDNS
jgi:hypothetical protein